MPGSVLWFILVLVALPLAWLAGRRASAIRDHTRRACVIGGVFLLLMGWAVMIHHPATAVELIPVWALARLEGIGAAPLFVFVLAVGWRLASLRRQRAIMIVGMFMGLGYFLHGGLWMMRPTPTSALGHGGSRYFVNQSQDYSCVPAACATSLRMLGVDTHEAEMAELTETRSGTGATLLRALNGISFKLQDSAFTPQLLEPTYDQLLRLQPPMLTPLRYETTRLHMVTILEVRPHLVVIADPQVGIEFISRREFIERYRGQVIAFDGDDDRADLGDVLAQHPYVQDPDAAPIYLRFARTQDALQVQPAIPPMDQP